MSRQLNSTRLLALAVSAGVLLPAAAWAKTEHFQAKLDAASEVPAKQSDGTGTLRASLNTTTKVFRWTLNYAHLSGPATAAHFHGPAAIGANGPVAVPITGDLASPVKGKATLTDAQITDLEAGNWYVNVHTAANPGGEIRGQVMSGK